MFRVKNFIRTGQRSLILILLMVAATTGIILLNYFSIKILAALRGYTSGESLYSKGQKDASRNLILYLGSHDEKYWQEFKTQIEIPSGYRVYRNGLDQGDPEMVSRGLKMGQFHPDEWKDAIWLYKNFKNTFLMKGAIRELMLAESIIIRLSGTGRLARAGSKPEV